jgi:SnoaL-like domain
MALSAIRTGSHASQIALLNHFHLSAATCKLEEYFGCFYSPTSRFLGTDATENWSAVEFYDYAKPHFDNGSGWTYVPRPDSRKFEVVSAPDGTPIFVTFDEILDVEAFGAEARGTGTMIFDSISKYWFIVQYHLSFPTPNELAHEICKKIANHSKKLQVKLSTEHSDAIAAELLAELKLEEAAAPLKSNSKKKKNGKS